MGLAEENIDTTASITIKGKNLEIDIAFISAFKYSKNDKQFQLEKLNNKK